MRTISSVAARTADDRFSRYWGEFRVRGAGACDLLVTWIARSRERRALAALDEDGRKDIGVSAADVEAEYRKPLWRP